MIVLFELAMFVGGLRWLATGRFELINGTTLTGPRTRIAGLVLMLPLPFSITLSVLAAVGKSLYGWPTNSQSWRHVLDEVNAAFTVLCLFVMIGVMWFWKSHQTPLLGKQLEGEWAKSRQEKHPSVSPHLTNRGDHP